MIKSLITCCIVLSVVYGKSQGVTFEGSHPCKIDTIKGILYRSVEYGSHSIETGYFIAPCGGLQIGGIPVMGQEESPIWIPGRYLRRDEVDNNGRLVYKEFHQQYNPGYFTDEKYKKIPRSSVYGLLVERKKPF